MYIQSLFAAIDDNFGNAESELWTRAKGLQGISDLETPSEEVKLYLGALVKRLKYLDINSKASNKIFERTKAIDSAILFDITTRVINNLKIDRAILEYIHEHEEDEEEFFKRLDEERGFYQKVIDQQNELALTLQMAAIKAILDESLSLVESIIEYLPKRIELLEAIKVELEEKLEKIKGIPFDDFFKYIDEAEKYIVTHIGKIQDDVAQKISKIEMPDADKSFLDKHFQDILSTNHEIGSHIRDVRARTESMLSISKDSEKSLMKNLGGVKTTIFQQKQFLAQAKQLKSTISSEIEKMSSSVEEQSKLANLANEFSDQFDDHLEDITDPEEYDAAVLDLEAIEELSVSLQDNSVENQRLLQKLKLLFTDYDAFVNKLNSKNKLSDEDKRELEQIVLKFKEVRDDYSILSKKIQEQEYELIASMNKCKTKNKLEVDMEVINDFAAPDAPSPNQLLRVVDSVIAKHYEMHKEGIPPFLAADHKLTESLKDKVEVRNPLDKPQL